MAVTLIEVAKATRSALGKGVIMDLLRQAPLLKMIPIHDIDQFELKETRWQTLPSVGNRALGGTYTESTGTLENFGTTLAVYGGDISIDRMYTKVNAVENPLATQTKMKTAALAAKLNDDFINGDHSVNPNGFEGLAKMVSNNPSRCTINLETAGDTLKVLADSAKEHTFIDALHQALKVLGVPWGTDGTRDANVAFFMNETTYLGIGQVLRRLSLLTTAKDAYARTWDMFGPAKLVDAGFKADQATEIIPSNELAGDAGTDSTSIYAVRFGGVPTSTADGQTEVIADSGVQLLQLKGTGPEPYDPLAGGEGGASANPGYVRRIDWMIGPHQRAKYSIVRIKGFKMAAS